MRRAWPLAAALAFSLAANIAAAAAAEVFDKPLRAQHVRLPPDADNPGVKREVVCWFYADYVIKQVDFGEVGAERLAILPAQSGNASKKRACREARESDEYVIPVETWSGYFAGAKSGFAFFNGEDGVNSGMGFMVMRIADKKKLVEDSVDKSFESMETRDGSLLVRYRRIYSATCSVLTAGASCTDAIAKATGIAKASLAICDSGYRAAMESLARERCKSQSKPEQQCMVRELENIRKQKWDASPSVIGYEVELDLRGAAANATKDSRIKSLGDAVSCYPAD